MKTGLIATCLLAVVLVLGLPVSAHHGGAAMNDALTEFKNVTVTKFVWANPHCLLRRFNGFLSPPHGHQHIGQIAIANSRVGIEGEGALYLGGSLRILLLPQLDHAQ